MSASQSKSLLLFAMLFALSALLAGCGSGGTPIVDQPTFTPAPGAYTTPQTVTLTDTNSDAKLFYTTDGSVPGSGSTPYTAPTVVGQTTTLEVTAVMRGYRNSSIVYATPQASIFYMTNGSAPTASSTPYTGGIPVTSTTTIQAIAIAPNFSPSLVASATYTVAMPVAATPTFTPPAGTYNAAPSVQILDTTPGAQIFYTTDGSQPSMASIPYAGPINVASSEQISAVAYAKNYAASSVATAQYAIATTISSNPGQWTWIAGTPNLNDPGSYGTLGVASPGDTPPSRYMASGIADRQGGLWLFGGIMHTTPAVPTGDFNDLWRFNTTSLQWTWVNGSDQPVPVGSYGTQGLSTPENVPPPRGASASWLDTTGNLWIFGGLGNQYANVFEYGDQWEFSPASGLWTWVVGSDTWVQGNSSPGEAADYGTLRPSSPSTTPGARDGMTSWTDSTGALWLFGGTPSTTGGGMLNDLWRYQP
jgi:hypothetical protein